MFICEICGTSVSAERKSLCKSDRIGQKNLRHLRNLRDPFKFQAAQAAKKSVFIREICGTRVSAERKSLCKSDRIGQKNLRHLRNLRDPFNSPAAQAAKKSV